MDIDAGAVVVLRLFGLIWIIITPHFCHFNTSETIRLPDVKSCSGKCLLVICLGLFGVNRNGGEGATR